MAWAYFTSNSNKNKLQYVILDTLDEAFEYARCQEVELYIMCFYFTDPLIARKLTEIAKKNKLLKIRIIADWSQGSLFTGRQINYLAGLGFPNVEVRYKYDQPYIWDKTLGRLRWSYRKSTGLLHHKSLAVIVGGRPKKLVCGSFNWTKKAGRNFENILIFYDDNLDSRLLMLRFHFEFVALWTDGKATLSPDEARIHFKLIHEGLKKNPKTTPADKIGLDKGVGGFLPELLIHHNELTLLKSTNNKTNQIRVAFSSCLPYENSANGFSEINQKQYFLMYRTSGKLKRVPVTITTLSLDTIFRARQNDTLKIAMHALSHRVPEYSAILEAARRKVNIQLLLDKRLGRKTFLDMVQHKKRLPVEVRLSPRMMHQKYIIHPESNTLLTGTANITTDASGRHAEHRIQIRNDFDLLKLFKDDFDNIWARSLR